MKIFLVIPLLLPVLAQAHEDEYQATIRKVYDGDAMTADIDLGEEG